jgi:uncharacterized membrane-anchored protein
MDIVSSPAENANPDVTGPAKSDRRLARLLRRLKPGDIAVVDMPDMDAWTADQLLRTGVIAVVNAAESITGHSPTAGASILLDAGVAVLDRVGPEVLEELQQGETLSIMGGTAELRGGVAVQGVRLTREMAEMRLQAAQQYIALAVSKMATAVASKMSGEWAYFLQSARVPALEPILRGKLAAVVVRSEKGVEELRAARRRLASCVVVAAEQGVDDAVRVGITPRILVGRAARLSDDQLMRCPEVVLLQDPGESEPEGLDRCGLLGVHPHALVWPGPPEEAAVAIAADCGARSVLQVGQSYNFAGLVRRGDKAVSAAILTRLRLGARLVDAEALRRLAPRFSLPPWGYGVLSAVAVAIVLLLIQLLLR